ncbi:hypothetical protein EIK77_004881 [Talaromyces pinophilus]|uniref:Uncharacterized protein n=1 Tax=Talaromyces pinophilus TaxID=128442 RepID=A0A6V8HJ00_TALPI|nr:hypothetical protein DPV78_009576 [Talaromyces pinophilus]KAI7974789.1 hypothetical protein EIK77_004881 [Talaromyces pinophilus]PCH00652.1 Hypothetical protein PENO1_046860 [Penicillium occitanis (nom. inval.)]PCH01479.1 hypothetical protein PENOC_047890 [Penicillium occitanis (nom. inval.)]GAM41405.1 hypothetical protein TCE0_042f14501 [Talaromyces pinophilus]
MAAVDGTATTTVNPPRVTLRAPSSLFHHELVTKDYGLLQFHAAAALQLQFGTQRHELAATSDDRLIASPYNDPGNLLDLKRLETPYQLLAKALTIFKPIRDDYATAPYIESFNWQAVVDFLRDLSVAEGYQWKRQRFYVVSFRSTLKPDIDNQRLHDLDYHSHQEAMASGGLLKYWFGAKNEKHQNLATCVWRSREDARAGGTGPWHKQARAAAGVMYDTIVFKTLALVIGDDASSWKISDWTDQDV